MKKNKILNGFFFGLCLTILTVSCDSDEETGTSTDFETIASNYYEADGAGTITIPFRNQSASFASHVEVELGGTATEGEDYTLGSVTEEGIQINILDDNNFEPNEVIQVRINSSGNSIHNITVVSNCGDTANPYLKYFTGEWEAIEKYGPTPVDWYGPYHLDFTQDEDDATIFHTDNFYDAGRTAYVKFDVAAGTVHFPNQQPLPDAGAPTLLTGSSGTFVIDECNDATTLTITLNYDGGVWIYSLVKL